MHNLKRLFAACLALALLAVPAQALADQTAIYPLHTASPRDFDTLAPDGVLDPSSLTSTSAVIMDADTGDILFEKNAHDKAYPASTTKIMTCLLALELGNLSDNVTAGEIKMPSDASKISLVNGETMTLEQLLYGLMLRSGNDAAITIGRHLSGSEDAFVELMNERAAALGMTGTHYVNTHGYHDENHYTTAYDMALLMREAYKNETFRKITGTAKYDLPATNKRAATTWWNTNKLIDPRDDNKYSYNYATGGKTGFTSPAKNCLVATASKDGFNLIAVNLGDTSSVRWSTNITMFEYGFKYFTTVNLRDYAALGVPPTIQVEHASPNDPENGALTLTVVPQNDYSITVRRDALASIESGELAGYATRTELNEGLRAPIGRDEEVGRLIFSRDGEDVLTCALLASRSVEGYDAVDQPTDTPQTAQVSDGATSVPTATPQPGENPGRRTRQVIIYILIALLSLVVVVLVIRMINLNRRRTRRNTRGTRGTRGRRR